MARSIPLRAFLILPFLLLFLSAAALVGWAGYRSGRQSIEQFERQMAAEIGVRISAHLDRFFSAAVTVVLFNGEAIRAGRLNPEHPEELQREFVGQMRHLPYLTFVSFGRADGQYVGATRLLDSNELRLMTALRGEGMTLDTFVVDDGNRRGERVGRGPAFDATGRIWFQRARESGAISWYPVYKYKPYASLGIGVSAPVFAPGQPPRLLGVVAGDVALTQIGRYLRSQSVGRNGMAFVAEPDGKLIATSRGEPVFVMLGDTVRRFTVAEYADGRFQMAGRAMQAQGATPGQYFFEHDGERYLLDLRNYQDKYGLQLLVGVILPERDFSAGFEANLRTVVWVCVAVALLGALIGVVLTGWLVRPLTELDRRAARIAGGEWSDQPAAPGPVIEINRLELTFNAMAARLREAFAGLEARVTERTHELEQANDALERLASLDGLTHIANRRRFDAVLFQEWRRCQREKQSLAVLMIDVDDFKAYNDTYGHQAGDDVLIRIASLCNGEMQRAGDLVARYGGEEFSAVLANTDLAGAREVAEAIAGAVRDARLPHARATAAPIVTVSIGVAAQVPDLLHGGPETLLRAADEALYAAKRGGRNRIEAAPARPA